MQFPAQFLEGSCFELTADKDQRYWGVFVSACMCWNLKKQPIPVFLVTSEGSQNSAFSLLFPPGENKVSTSQWKSGFESQSAIFLSS